MILPDTSIWVDHLRRGEPRLAEALARGEVFGHVWVIGELALGRIPNRAEVLRLLGRLPRATVAIEPEILAFVAAEDLAGRGIGFVDAALLASTRLSGASLWTRDKRLRAVAVALGASAAHD